MKTSGKALEFATLGVILMVTPAFASDVEFRLITKCSPELAHYPSPYSDKEILCVSSDVIMSDANIVKVKPGHTNYSSVVEFEFDDAAQRKVEKVTREHVGGQIALMSKGKLVTAAMISSTITGRILELNLPDEGRQSVLDVLQDRKLVK